MEKTLRGIAQYARKNYLSYWIILGIDTTISVVCSLIAYAVIHYMAHIPVSDWVFCQFVLVSLLGSVVGSLLFHTYRNTIRFSQARELWRVMCAVLFKSVWLLAVSFWVIPETSAFDKYRFSCLLLAPHESQHGHRRARHQEQYDPICQTHWITSFLFDTNYQF